MARKSVLPISGQASDFVHEPRLLLPLPSASWIGISVNLHTVMKRTMGEGSWNPWFHHTGLSLPDATAPDRVLPGTTSCLSCFNDITVCIYTRV